MVDSASRYVFLYLNSDIKLFSTGENSFLNVKYFYSYTTNEKVENILIDGMDKFILH